jgi:hypothetical protein
MEPSMIARYSAGRRSRVWKRNITLSLLSLALTCALLTPGTLWAATITAASCSRADVGIAVDRAANGDIVLVPAGSCTWPENLTITNKYLTLQGAGIDQTIIIDGVGKATYPNIPQVLVWVTNPGGLTRLTGMTFQGGTITDIMAGGMVVIRGTSHQFRLDHCKFVPTKTPALFFYDYVLGVNDHNLFDVSAAKGIAVYAHHNTWNRPNTNYGDASWADYDSLGTERALFFEDNTFLNNQSAYWYYYAVDGWMGGRVVYRHNTFQATVWANHGTESGGRQRGQRQFEVYNNNFIWDMKAGGANSFPSLIGSRGGVGVVFNNTAKLTNGWTNTFFDVTNLRVDMPYSPWGQCGTSSTWDENTSFGYRCIDQVGTGMSDLLSGDSPTPVGFLHNAVSPTYAWNNTINGVQQKIVSRRPNNVVLNRDFFDAIKPGYTPYIYPHPLVSGSTSTNPPPTPPTGVTVR